MNKYHEEQFNNIKAYIERIERDNKFLLNEIEKLDENNLQARIDKAIDYIMTNHCLHLLDKSIINSKELIDILKGSDKDEKE